MSKRKTAIGIAVLFALALSAFSAASASAATSGTTAFTCVKDEKGSFFGEHCLTTGGGTVKYKHVAIKQDQKTTGTATNANTTEETKAARKSILKGVISGVVTEIQCPEVHGEGTFENKLSGEEHFATAEGRLHYTGCVVTAPAGKGCIVKAEGGVEGTITTENLLGTTTKEMSAEIKPKEGTTFTTIRIEGCSVGALNNTFPVQGSLVAQINGATLTSTHAEITTQGTLKFAGQKAGLDGALTLKAHSEAGEETHPLTATTVPFSEG